VVSFAMLLKIVDAGASRRHGRDRDERDERHEQP
jgi:hypothetical protein